jgi:hypothetical protein
MLNEAFPIAAMILIAAKRVRRMQLLAPGLHMVTAPKWK